MKVYMGEEGWCIAAELRSGSWNGQNEFLYVLERSFEVARAVTALPLLYRVDSQHDALVNLVWMHDSDPSTGSGYRNDCIIKWNKRRESAHKWLRYAKELGQWCRWTEPRPGKRVGTLVVLNR